MNSLFNQPDYSGIVARINKLAPDTKAQWGKMNVAQMLAHCNASMETARGLNTIKPLLIGKLIGSLFFKAGALNQKPFGKNSPTASSYIFPAGLDFEAEKEKLLDSVSRFAQAGPSGATTRPHPFFGSFKPDQWGVFQWKHLDHHLRQFGV